MTQCLSDCYFMLTILISISCIVCHFFFIFFFKQKTAYDIGLGIPAEPLFRSLSAADLPPSPTKSSNLSETAEVPACNVPSRSPLPALAIAPETKLGTASSGLGTLEP